MAQDGREPSAFVEKVRTLGVGFNGLEQSRPFSLILSP